MRGWATVIVTLASAFAIASPAGAATTVGKTFTPDETCPVNSTFLMSGVPGFSVPSDGVITSWHYQAAATFVPTAIKLKMARPAGGNDFTIIGESDPQSPSPSQLNSYSTRIPVLTGDVLGIHDGSPDPRFCGHTLVSTTYHRLLNADPPPGTTSTYAPEADFELDVAATLEPDADRDGYGDETQDCAPTDATKNVDCASPDVRITRAPKAKTRKKTATFEFTGTDARVVAGFQCSLDGAAYSSCASPHTLKVKKGKHTFSVKAVDVAGNADASPATYSWKVKKKKKKK